MASVGAHPSPATSATSTTASPTTTATSTAVSFASVVAGSEPSEPVSRPAAGKQDDANEDHHPASDKALLNSPLALGEPRALPDEGARGEKKVGSPQGTQTPAGERSEEIGGGEVKS